MNDQASRDELSREETIFNAAIQLRDPAKRAVYLDLACEHAPELRARIQKLLASDAGDSFFAKPLAIPSVLPAEVASAVLSSRAAPSPTPDERIGRYRLMQKLGEGGCGVVYMAEQEEPVRRRVALKLIKLGMDTRAVIARFEAERQALALMDHPNIAKVLDAGATETGRPYFVMELVGGIRITDYCAQNQLDTRQRLDLFIQVCRAVQHAHQKGIIHRDLKPSNVLVATHDGVATPKVIDFGIAKATQGKLTDQTLFTAFEQFLGTPAYMSPEQTQVGGLDVDTRSDIYSLGVLLYELLTGKTPFDTKELLAAGIDAMRRTIQEKEPPTPSTRLKEELASQPPPTSAESKIRNQKSKIANDLDWIVMKCLEKDRARRYETANGLAVDIERHLNNEPVLASPPSTAYRVAKAVQRNKLAFTIAGAVSLSLLAGLGVSSWMYFKERAATHEQVRLRREADSARHREAELRGQAQTEAVKSRQVAQLLSEMLGSAGPAKAQGRDATILVEILDRTTERLIKELTGQPEVQLQLLPTLAETYRDLGQYKEQGYVAEENLRVARRTYGAEHAVVAMAIYQLASARRLLGDYEEAEALHREALAMRRNVLGNDSLEVARSLNGLALVLNDRSKPEEAEASLSEALVILRKRLGRDDIETASVLNNLGIVLRQEGKLAEAETRHRENVNLRRNLLGTKHLDVASSLNNLAVVLGEERKSSEAETAAREALEIRQKVLGKEHPQVANTLSALGEALQDQGRLAEAENQLNAALAIRRKCLGREHPLVANSLNSLAMVLKDQGKLEEAEIMEREALSTRRKLLGDEHADTITSLNNLGTIKCCQGKLEEAVRLQSEALRLCRKTLSERNPELRITLSEMGFTLESAGMLNEAELLGREWLALERRHAGLGITQVVASLNFLASILLQEGKLGVREKLTEAETLAHQAFADCEKMPESCIKFSTQALLGACLLLGQQYTEAESLLLSGYEGMRQSECKTPRDATGRMQQTLEDLAQLYEVTGRAEQAAKWKEKSDDFKRAQTDRNTRHAPANP